MSSEYQFTDYYDVANNIYRPATSVELTTTSAPAPTLTTGGYPTTGGTVAIGGSGAGVGGAGWPGGESWPNSGSPGGAGVLQPYVMLPAAPALSFEMPHFEYHEIETIRTELRAARPRKKRKTATERRRASGPRQIRLRDE